MFVFAAIALLAIMAFAFSRLSRVPASATLDPAAAKGRLDGEKGLQLIDVRSHLEYRSGHLPGAKLIPLQELGSRLGEIDASRPVIVYCRSGHRSGLAMQILSKAGFKAACHIGGGILAWESAGLPTQK